MLDNNLAHILLVSEFMYFYEFLISGVQVNALFVSTYLPTFLKALSLSAEPLPIHGE